VWGWRGREGRGGGGVDEGGVGGVFKGRVSEGEGRVSEGEGRVSKGEGRVIRGFLGDG